MLKPDPTRYSSVVQSRGSGPEWMDADSTAETESHHGQAFRRYEDLPTDVALDLRLHEILQQARLTTAANGVVIALARGDRMVCRATLGDRAPSVGVSMNTRSGLSGACVQTREMQLCDDTLVDARVNTIACRDLGMRSIVVLPVLNSGELWGVLEVFSSSPHAFSESDLQALQSLSRKISRTVQEAVEGGSNVVVLPLSSRKPAAELPPESAAEEIKPDWNAIAADSQAAGPRDFRTGILTAAVLALAVLLGWMVGRVGWSMAVNRAPVQLPAAAEEPPVTAQVTPQPAAPARHEEATAAASPSVPKPSPPVPAAPKPKAVTKVPDEPAGGLVIYEQGKVVFRMPPTEAKPAGKVQSDVVDPDSNRNGVIEPGAIQKAATREDDPLAPSNPASAQAENSYVLKRIEPEYPEAAKEQHIQGPVILRVLVGTDGTVRNLTVISGDPQLAGAATEAVRQWRFRPHEVQGKAVEFETRIKVNFSLAE